MKMCYVICPSNEVVFQDIRDNHKRYDVSEWIFFIIQSIEKIKFVTFENESSHERRELKIVFFLV